MTTSEVKLNDELARIAEEVAASRGERLEDVVDRLIREYINDETA
jgi:hypothetical protein